MLRLLTMCRSTIGRKLMLTMAVGLLLTVGALTVISIRQLNNFGLAAVTINQHGLTSSTRTLLDCITHEQAECCDQIFRRMAANACVLAERARFLIQHPDSTAPETLRDVGRLHYEPRILAHTNAADASTRIDYWALPEVPATVRARIKSLTVLDPLLRSIHRNNPEIAAMYIILESGLRVQYPRPESGLVLLPSEYDPRRADYYTMAAPAQNPDGDLVWSRIRSADDGSEPVVSVCAPIFLDGGTFVGIAGIDLKIRTIAERILTAPRTQGHQGFENIVPFLIDRHGVIVAAPQQLLPMLGLTSSLLPPSNASLFYVHNLRESALPGMQTNCREILAAPYFLGTQTLADGSTFLLSAHTLCSTGWKLCLMIPEASVMAPVVSTRKELHATLNGTVERIAILTLGIVLLGFGLTAALVKSIITPLQQLGAAARKVSAGDLNARAQINRSDETGMLAVSFNHMLEAMQQAHDQQQRQQQILAETVEQRTTELRLKNQQLEQTLRRLEQEAARHEHTSQSLRMSRSMLQLVMDTTPQALFWKNRNRTILGCNRRFARDAGYCEAAQVVGKNDADLPWQEAHVQHSLASEQRVMMTGRPEHNCIEQHRIADGSDIWVQASKIPLHEADGAVIGILVMYEDITDRLAVREQQKLLISAIEQIAEPIVIMQPCGNVQYINAAAERVFGHTRREADQYNPLQHIRQMHGDELLNEIMSTINGDRIWQGQIPRPMEGGITLELTVSIAAIRDDNQQITHYVAVCRDVTEMLNLQRELRQAQKMEAIGTLAGGIAHDFNNLLAVILGYSEMVRLKPDPDQLPNRINHIIDAGKRARDLVNQILTFSRRTDQKTQPEHMLPVVKETLKFLRASLPATIDIRTNLAATCDTVCFSPTHLHQVIMNLCTNAKHALGNDGGSITVTIDNLSVTTELSPLEIDQGDYFVLSVADDGCGMPRDVMEKMFDPFFTTKGPGEGTGLGLSVVHGIVTGSGGAIRVHSEPGHGTTFRIYLPLTLQRAPAAAAPGTDTAPGGAEKILVVDDERTITEMLQSSLEEMGYGITACTCPHQAQALFTRDPSRFDLVITDQTMPGMTGVHLARAMLALRPDIPIILCTGFSESTGPEQARSIGIKTFLIKPILPSELAIAIRKLLDTTADPCAA